MQDIAAHVNHLLSDALTQGEQQQPLDVHAEQFIARINKLLESMGGTPLKLDNISSEAPLRLQRALRQMTLEKNPITQAVEHSDLDKTAFYAAIRDLNLAVTDYCDASGISISFDGTQTERDTLPEDNERPHLYKRTLHRGTHGQWESTIEEVDRIDFSEKCVIGMGGYSQNHMNEHVTRGFLRHVGRVMGGDAYCGEQNLSTYILTYPVAHRTHYQADTFAYNADPNHYVNPTIRHFCDNILMPSLGVTEGLSDDALKSELEKVNLFAFSYGTVCAKQLANAMAEQLRELGYEQKTIQDAISHTYCMNIGPTARIDIEKPYGDFSSVYVASPHDLASRSKSDLRPYLENEAVSTPVREHELFIRSNAPKQGFMDIPDEPLTIDDKGIPHGKFVKDPRTHDVRTYTLPHAVMTVHDPHYVQAFLRYGVHDKQGAIDAHENRFNLPDKGTKEPTGKFVAAALARAAESASHVNER